MIDSSIATINLHVYYVYGWPFLCVNWNILWYVGQYQLANTMAADVAPSVAWGAFQKHLWALKSKSS